MGTACYMPVPCGYSMEEELRGISFQPVKLGFITSLKKGLKLTSRLDILNKDGRLGLIQSGTKDK